MHTDMLADTNAPLPLHALDAPQLRGRETGTALPRAARHMCTTMLHAVETRTPGTGVQLNYALRIQFQDEALAGRAKSGRRIIRCTHFV